MPGQYCHRYGPGRLPYASRRDVGAGIAMAAAGLLAGVLWFGGAGLLVVTGLAEGLPGLLMAGGVYVVPLAIPAAFVVGTLLWRARPPAADKPPSGAFLGAMTALASLVVGACGPPIVLGGWHVLRGEMPVSEVLSYALMALPFSLLFTVLAVGWLVVPLGAVCGWYHERARGSS